MPTRKAQSVWKGGLQNGDGIMYLDEDKTYPFSAGSRFGEEEGNNPEEMLGAAHSGCFSMAFSHALEAHLQS